jgi:NAD(P)-dependent dehydrogenase (short-subunit alcohol dehydrogenase family)
MKLDGKVAVVTGAANGIGRALAVRFAGEGAKGVVLADIDERGLAIAAAAIGGLAVACDSTKESDVTALIATAERAFGQVDVFVSNAGIYRTGDEDTSDADWALSWNLHVMAHVYAARDLMPKMTAHGDGYFIITASAAGLLSHISAASYAVTKNAAVAFGEYLSIVHGDSGVRVSVICPQRVHTNMTEGLKGSASLADGIIEPEQVATCVIEAMDAERFLILPHPAALEYFRRKSSDYDRWLRGMRRAKARFRPDERRTD